MQRKSATDNNSVSVTTVPAQEEEGGMNAVVEVDSSGISLRRSLGLTAGSSMIIGIVIGSGIFISPKGVLARSGSVALSIIVWILSGFIALFGALSYAELGTLLGKSGGDYQYLREAYGNVLAYLYAWIVTVVQRPAGIAVVLLTFAEYAATVFHLCGAPRIPVKLIAAIALVMVTFVNCYSATLAARIQVVFTVAKVGALFIIIVGGIIRLCQGHTSVLETGFEGTIQSPTTISFAFYSALWAYSGWNNLNNVVEELKEPEKNLPRANILAVIVVIVVYTLTNVSYYTALSAAQVLSSNAVAVTWGDKVLGAAAILMPISVMISTFGNANGGSFTGSRLLYVAARHGNVPDVLSYVHCLNYTPVPSLLFSVCLSLIMIIPGDIGSLIDFLSFTEWMFNCLNFTSLIIFRFRTKWKDAPRTYTVPLAIPVVMVFVSLYLVIAPIVDNPKIEFMYAFLFMLAGLVFYVPFVHFKAKFKCYDRLATFMQLLLQVVPSKREE